MVLAACGRIGFDPNAADAAGGEVSPPVSCGGRMVVRVPETGLVSFDVAAQTGDATGSCGGAGVADAVFEYDVPIAGAQLEIATDLPATSSDTLLYVRTTCDAPATELVCDVSGGIGSQAAYRLGALPVGPLFVFLDGDAGATGHVDAAFELLLPLGAPCEPNTVGRRCGPELTCANAACMPATCDIAQVLGGSATITADTRLAPNVHAASPACGEGDDGGQRGPELVYTLNLTASASDVEISTVSPQTDYDTLVYMRMGCNGAQVACDDDASNSLQADAHSGPLAPGTYSIFIDGFSTSSGKATVTITVTP